MKKFQAEFRLAPWIRRVLLAWLAGALGAYLGGGAGSLAGLETLQGLSPWLFALCFFAALVLLSLAGCRWRTKQLERWAMAGLFALLAGISLIRSFSWAFLVECLVILGILVDYAQCGWNGRKVCPVPVPEGNRCWRYVAAFLGISFFAFVSVWTVCRVLSFGTPTFDFGLFAQMFDGMRKTGLPVTTLERDWELSHFLVHVSPIYYLMLPFYCLVPRPETLQVLQAAVLALAVIPMWKLCRFHGLPGWAAAFLCAALVCYPALSGGTSYDLHENCFLVVLLLGLLYGLDRQSIPVTAVCALLTLLVKEDAAVYVAVAGLYVLLRSLLRRERTRFAIWAGLALLAGALGWFVGVTSFLDASGDGVMSWRYNNFLYDGSGSLLTVVKAAVLCPMKVLFECVDGEKLPYLALTMGPLLGLPLWTRRYEGYVLLIPWVLVNLMPDYQYQHNIFFQYSFGSLAFLFYLTARHLGQFRKPNRRGILAAAAVVVSAVCLCTSVVPKAVAYPTRYAQYRAYYDELRELLGRIPEEASVTASTYYTTYLSGRRELYDVRYTSWEHLMASEYVVLDVNLAGDYENYATQTQSGFQSLTAWLEAAGYEKVDEIEGKAVVYRKK